MKYQYKLNDEILFETDSVVDYINFLKRRNDADSVLAHLLDKAGSYIVDVATN